MSASSVTAGLDRHDGEALRDRGVGPLRVVFGPDRCELVMPGGGRSALPIHEPDRERALRSLERLNALRTREGARVASLVTVDGFECWWFVQHHLFEELLVPYTRYEAVVRWVERGAVVENPPADLAPLLAAFARSGLAPHPVPHGSRAAATIARASLRAQALVSWVSALWFRLRRAPVAFYAIDVVTPGLRGDFRLDRLYRELERRRIGFGEYVHSLADRRAWANLVRRRRLCVYLRAAEGRDDASPELDLAAVPEKDRPVLRAAAAEGLRAARRARDKYRTIRRLLRLHRPRAALVLDDSRHAHELVAACRDLGIYVLGYQHGLAFNRYFVGLMAYGFDAARARPHRPDAYGLWSAYFRERLLRHSRLHDASSTFVCGPLRVPALAAASRQQTPSASAPLRVLVVSESQTSPEEVVPYVARLVGRPDRRVSLKLRPGEALRAEWAELARRGLGVDRSELYAAIAACDVVLGTYSSVLYEAMALLKPVVVVRTKAPFGFELAEEGLAELADGPDGLDEAIRGALRLPSSELERRRSVVWGEGAPKDGARELVERLARVLSPETAS